MQDNNVCMQDYHVLSEFPFTSIQVCNILKSEFAKMLAFNRAWKFNIKALLKKKQRVIEFFFNCSNI